MALRLRHDLHLTRKAWHFTMGAVMANMYYNGMSRQNAINTLTQVFFCVVFLEWMRLNVPQLNDLAIKMWRPFMRTSEVHSVSGTPWYIASVAIVIAVFPKEIALLGMLFLAVGDPLSSIVGIKYGDYGPRFKGGKSLIGTLAGCLSCSAIALVFFRHLSETHTTQWLMLSLGSGFSGGAAELLPLDVDDNFSIPLVTGLATWALAIILGVSIF